MPINKAEVLVMLVVICAGGVASKTLGNPVESHSALQSSRGDVQTQNLFTTKLTDCGQLDHVLGGYFYASYDIEYPYNNIFSVHTNDLLFYSYVSYPNWTYSNLVCEDTSEKYANIFQFDNVVNIVDYKYTCTVQNSTLLYEILSSPIRFTSGGYGAQCWCSIQPPPSNTIFISGIKYTFYGQGSYGPTGRVHGCAAEIFTQATPLVNGDTFLQQVTMVTVAALAKDINAADMTVAAVALGVLVPITFIIFVILFCCMKSGK